MQQQVMRREDILEELNEVKAQLSSIERERDHAINEVKEIKRQMNNADVKKLKEDLRNAKKELQVKDNVIKSLESEVVKVKKLELELSQNEDFIRNVTDEANGFKSSLARSKSMLSDSRKNADRYNKAESLDTKTLLDEIDTLKGKLKKSMEAEDASNRAMDDLAVALKEVATESNETKEKLTLAEKKLQEAKEEAANLRFLLKSKEEDYEMLMKELKKEIDQLNNTVNRLRLEAEESVLAFNDREIQFVDCIKSTEEEKSSVQEECNRLAKSLKEAEEISEKPKEEIKRLRDILKQALNEAKVAKEAASLAEEENSYLKDFLTEKDKALVTLVEETERLRVNEAEANESIKELKRVISSGSKESAKPERENKEQKKEKEQSKEVKKEKEHSREQKKGTKTVSAGANSEKEHKKGRRLSKTFSFDLNQLWPVNPSKTKNSSKDFDEDFDEDDALGGSMYDLVDSSKELPNIHQKTASACSSEGKLNFDQFDEDTHFDEMENDKASQGKRNTLLRRFGDLLRRKNPHPPKDLPQPPKEVAPTPKEIPA